MKTKLYHAGIHGRVSRSTLADVNETRGWRIYAAYAQVLIRMARKLHAGDGFGVSWEQAAYVFDSSTADLRLSLFPWATFRKRKGAVKVHPLIDLRGSITCFVGTPRENCTMSMLWMICRSNPAHSTSWTEDASTSSNCIFLMRRRISSLQSEVARGTVVQMDQAKSADQGFLWDVGECRENPGMDRHQRVCARRHNQEAVQCQPEPRVNSASSHRRLV